MTEHIAAEGTDRKVSTEDAKANRQPVLTVHPMPIQRGDIVWPE